MTGQTVPNSMYLVLPVPFRLQAGELHVEAQAMNGLDRWADHFAQVTVAAPLVPEALLGSLAGVRWTPVAGLAHRSRICCEPLPWAYTPVAFLRARARVVQQLRAGIARAEHLQFAIGGLVGDWAAVAALEARKMGRRYAIHTDRVEHEVMRKTAAGNDALRRVRVALEAPLVRRLHARVIRGAALGLWHGDDCFRAYAPWCTESHLIHDVHTKQSDLIGEAELAAKLEDARSAAVLRLCYTGRLDPMKAPLEWLAAIAKARSNGASLTAVWFGEGALLGQVQAECIRLGLEEVVRFAGFVQDRAALLAEVRGAHALLFTHVTPESPRNLLEALVSGTPIVGYANAYADELVAERGGGALVPVHEHAALGALVATLAADRERLATLIGAAAANGRRFSDDAVFGERSELIKRFA